MGAFSLTNRVCRCACLLSSVAVRSVAGTEYKAQVEFAPFQRVPNQRRRRDPKEGKIESGVRPQTTSPDANVAPQHSQIRCIKSSWRS